LHHGAFEVPGSQPTAAQHDPLPHVSRLSSFGGTMTRSPRDKPQNQGSIEQVKRPIPYLRTRWACVCGRVRDRNDHQLPRAPPCRRRHNADEPHAFGPRARGHRERAHPPSTRGRSPARRRSNETPSSRRRMIATRMRQRPLASCRTSNKGRHPRVGFAAAEKVLRRDLARVSQPLS
jgi:hypothetical protein